MAMQKECDRCGNAVERFRDLKRINGEKICSVCYRKNREAHRKESIELDGAKDDLRILNNKIKREYYIKKVGADRCVGRPRKTNQEPPTIKGSNIQKRKIKSNSYLTLHERQDLFRILIDKGCTGEEAKERIRNLIEQQKNVRKIMKSKNKSEDEIKLKQQEILEELWRL